MGCTQSTPDPSKSRSSLPYKELFKYIIVGDTGTLALLFRRWASIAYRFSLCPFHSLHPLELPLILPFSRWQILPAPPVHG